VANRYWVGGTATWDTISGSKWSTTPGGAGGASVPTAADSVFFDQALTYTVTIGGATPAACLDFTVSAGTVTFAGTTALNISGSMSLIAGTVWSATGTVTFNATTIGKTVTTNGVTVATNITFNGVGGAWTLGSALTNGGGTRTVTLGNGTLNLSTFTLTTAFFNSNSSVVRTLAFGTGNILVLGAGGTLWNTGTTTNMTTTGTQVVNVSYTGGVATTVSSGTLNEANSISFNFTAGTYALANTAGTKRNLNFTGFAGTVSNTAQTIYGNLTLAAAATYTAGTNAWTFAATTTGRTITTNGDTMDFPVVFDGNGGGWALQDAMTVGSTRTTTLTRGTLSLGSFTLSTGGFSSSNSNTRTLNYGTGNITATGSAGWNTATTTSFTLTGTGALAVTCTGQATITAGTWSEASAINFNINTTSGSITIATGSLGNLTILNNTITVGFGTSTLTIYGNLDIQGASPTITGSTGGLIFAATSGTKTIRTSGETIPKDITFNGVGGTWQLLDNLTVNSASGVGTTLTNGTLDLNGNTLTTSGFISSANTARTIAFGVGKISISNIQGDLDLSDSRNLSLTGTPVFQVSAIPNGLGLQSFGGTNAGYWTETTALSVSVGSPSGAAGIYIPSSGTLVFEGRIKDLTLTGFTGTWENTGLTLWGNFLLSSGMTFNGGSVAIFFRSITGGAVRTVTTSGKTIDAPVEFSGNWALQDAMTLGSTQALTHAGGTLDLNGNTLTVGTSYVTAAGNKNLTFNGGTLVCPAASATAFNNAVPTGFTTTAGTGTGAISMTAATAKTFVGGGSTFNCTLNQGGAGALTITGANTFNNITNTVQPASVLFTAGTTSTFNNFNLNGTPGNLITLASATAATHTLSKASGTVSVDYLSITNSTATGGATWNAGPNSVNGGGNTGWIFSGAPVNTSAFFIIL
jgi:hypothetical protein